MKGMGRKNLIFLDFWMILIIIRSLLRSLCPAELTTQCSFLLDCWRSDFTSEDKRLSKDGWARPLEISAVR
jgi:hypothetical protein